MATLAELRSEARKLGIAPSVVRSASSARALREIIVEFQEENGSKSKPAAKKAVKKAVVKKAAATTTPRRRGRPPGSKNKPKPVTRRTTASKSAPAAKSTTSRATGKAKRPTAASSRSTSNGNGGRNLLGKINYNKTDGWSPREDSAPDRIVKALRRFKGDRTKVFNFLKKDVWDFCSKRMRDGTKRKLRGDKYGAEEMLRYRIARTDWDFAVQTGQHEASEDRVEYGTGGTGEGIYKPAKKVPAKRTTSTRSSSRNSTRSTRSTSTKRTTSTRSTRTTAKAAPAKRRGRPPGSKNKPKVTARAASTTKRRTAATRRPRAKR